MPSFPLTSQDPDPRSTRRSRPMGRAFGSLLLAVLASTIVVACSDEPSATSEGGDSEALRLSSEDVQVLGTSEDLMLVRDLEVDLDGTIWVLNDVPPYFVGFDSEGGVTSMGSQGGGPREFRHPAGLVGFQDPDSPAAGIWVFDRGRHAMIRLTRAGAPAESVMASDVVPLPNDVMPAQSLLSGEGGIPGPLAWIDGAAGMAVVAHAPGEPPRGPAFWRARIVALDLDDGSFDERWDLRDLLDDPESHHPGADEFMPVPVWAVCPDGAAWLYDPAGNRLRALTDSPQAGSPGSAGAGEVELPQARRVPLTPDRMFELLRPRMIEEVPSDQRPPDDQMREMFEAEMGSIIEDSFASVLPEYFRMRCATDGTLWLQRFASQDGHGGAGWEWVRVSPATDPVRVESVRFPDGFMAMRFDGDRAWGIVRDSFDVPSVAWIELP